MRIKRMQWPWIASWLMLALLVFSSAPHSAFAAKQRGWLGVAIQEMTPSLQEALNAGDQWGLVITEVMDGSPAERAGLREEDIILKYDGKPVTRFEELARLVRRTRPGTDVTLVILRDGKQMEIRVKIGKRPRRDSNVFLWRGPGKTIEIRGGHPRLGVRVHDLDKDLASFFDVDAYEGVLVLEVMEDSPAEEAGLKAGDVILRIDDEKVHDADELREILEDYDEGDEVTLEIVRHGKRQRFTVTLEGKRFFGGFWWPPFPGFQMFDDDCEDKVIIIRPDLRHRLHQLRQELQRRKERLMRRNPGILVLDDLKVI
ncbi:MAG: PDZ domain-containing protein [candidate division KSB1 bacterium]|nr:PDZ domain-containing protein [candidate division KSB1 bacterium]